MVIGHHLVWTTYGCWLPNDPRGSGSTAVRIESLRDLGELHHGRKRVQPHGSDVCRFYDEATQHLKHPRLTFTSAELAHVGVSFGNAIRENGYTCWAAAVMPDHVHLVIRKHRDRAETMIEALQSRTAVDLRDQGLRPPDHPVWTRGGRKVFLNDETRVERTVRYVEANPVKAGLPVQRWDWATPYGGWPRRR